MKLLGTLRSNYVEGKNYELIQSAIRILKDSQQNDWVVTKVQRNKETSYRKKIRTMNKNTNRYIDVRDENVDDYWDTFQNCGNLSWK